MLDKEKYIDIISISENEETGAPIKLITDLSVIDKFEIENPNLPIGCISNEPFYTFRMDLYQNVSNNKVFRYCNVNYSKKGAASIVLIHTNEETFILLQKSYRPFLKTFIYEIPRGFADLKDNTPLQTAVRELFEETSIDVSEFKNTISDLGTIYPDSGLSNNEVSIFKIEIFTERTINIQNSDLDECISDYALIPVKDIHKYIPEIKDSFTLCALCKVFI